jgi:hypothetical protein
MKWPRISIRGVMVGVLTIALLLGLGLPAYEVYQGRRGHCHVFVALLDGKAQLDYEAAILTPFWSSYALRLSGKPWKRRPICGSGKGRRFETCEIDDVNVFYMNCFNSTKCPRATQAMVSKYPDLPWR